jgi:hypothetical protein
MYYSNLLLHSTSNCGVIREEELCHSTVLYSGSCRHSLLSQSVSRSISQSVSQSGTHSLTWCIPFITTSIGYSYPKRQWSYCKVTVSRRYCTRYSVLGTVQVLSVSSSHSTNIGRNTSSTTRIPSSVSVSVSVSVISLIHSFSESVIVQYSLSTSRVERSYCTVRLLVLVLVVYLYLYLYYCAEA